MLPRTALWLAVAALPLVIVCGCAKKPTSPTEDLPTCAVSSSSLNFGTVAVGTCSSTQSFTITNTGSGTLSGVVGASCEDFQLAVGGGPYELGAGQSRTVTVRFCPQSGGSRICTISTGYAQNVSCTGGGGECSVNPTDLDFGTVTVGYSADRTFSITNTGSETLSGTVSESCNAYSSENLVGGSYTYSLAPSQSATFTIRFTPTEAGGPQVCTISTGCAQDVSCTGAGRIAPPPEFMATWGGTGSQPGQFNFPRDIVTLADGTLLVVDYNNFRVQAISPLGAPLYSWAAMGAQVICLEPSGTVLIGDWSSKIRRFTLTGDFVKEWASYGVDPGVGAAIAGIAVDATGNIYVAEGNTRRVQKYSYDGTYIRSWGSRGTRDGEFERPSDIAIAPDGRVFVLDGDQNGLYGTGLVQIFTQDGVFLSRWGGAQTPAPGLLVGPTSIAFTPNGNVFITDGNHYRVVSFDASGNFLFDFGGYGSGPGQFPATPLAVAIDQDHRIYVADDADRISKFVESSAP